MPNGHVYLAAPNAWVDGETVGQWTEDWLKWVMHAPASSPTGTPLGVAAGYPDASAANGLVDNDGKVFFLYGGNWGNTNNPAIPTIDVPAGKPVLLPMIAAFDTEGPVIETITGYFDHHRGSYADEARWVTYLEQKSIYDAHLTITKVGDTKPLIDIHGQSTALFSEDTGIFALGAPQTARTDYAASILPPLGNSIKNLPYTEEIGRWAMIQGLTPGDYIVNFGGQGHAVIDPVSKQTIFGAWTEETTDRLHVS